MKKKSIIAARKFFFLRILCRIYYYWYNEEFSLIKISDIKRKIFRVKFYYYIRIMRFNDQCQIREILFERDCVINFFLISGVVPDIYIYIIKTTSKGHF